ncbi:MAG: hypothetical protein NXI30_19300 [bacterium]|nr:hypothetical protein [bacterium]
MTYGQLTGQPVVEDEAFAAIALEFRTQANRNRVRVRGMLFENRVRQAGEAAAERARDAIAIRRARIESLGVQLSDLRQDYEDSVRLAIESPLPDEPPNEESVRASQRARLVLGQLNRFHWRIALGLIAAVGLVCLETGLVFMTLDPILGSTAGSAGRLLPVLSPITSLVLFLLAHWTTNSKSKPAVRWMAGVGLVVISVVLAFLRMSLVEVSPTWESTRIIGFIVGIGILFVVPPLVMPLVATQSVEVATEALDERTAFLAQNADRVVDARTQALVTRLRRRWSAVRREVRTRTRSLFQTTLPREIARLENRILGEQAATRRLVDREVRRAFRELSGEIDSTARQIARWAIDERRQR